MPLLKSADPLRPWEVSGSGETFFVRRLHRGDSTTWDYYCGANQNVPLELSGPDAQYLAAILNTRARRRRQPQEARLDEHR